MRLTCARLAAALSVITTVAGAIACSTPTLGGGTLPSRPASVRAAFDAMPDGAVARVRILDDNVDAWVARLNAIEGATSTIDVQYFILDPDAYGLALLGLLAEKARAGVKVRLMIDARGAFGTIRGGQRFLLQEAQRAGVDVRVYNPIVFQVADAVASGDMRKVGVEPRQARHRRRATHHRRRTQLVARLFGRPPRSPRRLRRHGRPLRGAVGGGAHDTGVVS